MYAVLPNMEARRCKRNGPSTFVGRYWCSTRYYWHRARHCVQRTKGWALVFPARVPCVFCPCPVCTCRPTPGTFDWRAVENCVSVTTTRAEHPHNPVTRSKEFRRWA